MKILLDESVPQKLRLLLDNRHTVVTTWFQGWSGLKNGVLLGAAEEARFELFISADQELSYQQKSLRPEDCNTHSEHEQWDRDQRGYRGNNGCGGWCNTRKLFFCRNWARARVEPSGR